MESQLLRPLRGLELGPPPLSLSLPIWKWEEMAVTWGTCCGQAGMVPEKGASLEMLTEPDMQAKMLQAETEMPAGVPLGLRH